MRILITREHLDQRSREFARVHYMTLVSVMKGVALYSAATTMWAFLSDGLRWLSLMSWIASFLGMILTYEANMYGTLLMVWRPTWVDIVPAFALGVAEYLLFLIARESTSWWFCLFGIWAFLGGSLAYHARVRLESQLYAEEIQGVLKNYLNHQRSDNKSALLTSSVFIIAALCLNLFVIPIFFQYVLAAIAIGIMGYVIAHQEAIGSDLWTQ